VWALIAVLLAIGEILTPGLFFLGPIAVAATAAAIAAALAGGWVIDLVVFFVGSAASVGVLRRIARSHIRMPVAMRTEAAALAGAFAIVLEQVDLHGGSRKDPGGKFGGRLCWMRARSSSPERRSGSLKSRARRRSSTNRSPGD